MKEITIFLSNSLKERQKRHKIDGRTAHHEP
jgi:hypothetical protein